MTGRTICYACLSAPSDTRDHIPPYSFFLHPRPSNLITVPCCWSCNNGNSKEDDFARFVLTSLIDRSPAGETIWEEKVVPGFFPRNAKEIDAIIPSLRDVTLARDGEIIEGVAFETDLNRLSRYFTRMTKGLIRHHYPIYDYSVDEFQVRYFLPGDEGLEKLAEVRDVLQYEHVGDGVFQYRHGITDTSRSGLWLLVFYEAILVVVYHAKQGTTSASVGFS